MEADAKNYSQAPAKLWAFSQKERGSRTNRVKSMMGKSTDSAKPNSRELTNSVLTSGEPPWDETRPSACG